MKAFHKFLIGTGAMLLLSLVLTVVDSTVESIDIPFVPDLSINGKEVPELQPGEVLTLAQLNAELREIFPNARIEIADRLYQAVPDRDALALIDYMADFYWSTPAIRYRPESYDCDNFARAFVVIADLAKRQVFKGQLAFGRIYTFQNQSWAGVPAGGHHALVVLRGDSGWLVHEPQGSDYIDATQYPNRKHVTKLIFD